MRDTVVPVVERNDTGKKTINLFKLVDEIPVCLRTRCTWYPVPAM